MTGEAEAQRRIATVLLGAVGDSGLRLLDRGLSASTDSPNARPRTSTCLVVRPQRSTSSGPLSPAPKMHYVRQGTR